MVSKLITPFPSRSRSTQSDVWTYLKRIWAISCYKNSVNLNFKTIVEIFDNGFFHWLWNSKLIFLDRSKPRRNELRIISVQNVLFHPLLNRVTYPSLTNTKFHLERKEKGGGRKNDTKETTGSQRYEVSSHSRVYPVTPVTLVACI